TYRVFSGRSGATTSPTKNYVPVTMVEMLIPAGAEAVQDIPSDYNGFLYVLKGEGVVGKNKVKAEKGEVLWMETPDTTVENSEIQIEADKDLRVMFYAGKPLKEPVVARGPFVMNNEAELDQAFEDYRNNKF